MSLKQWVDNISSCKNQFTLRIHGIKEKHWAKGVNKFGKKLHYKDVEQMIDKKIWRISHREWIDLTFDFHCLLELKGNNHK